MTVDSFKNAGDSLVAPAKHAFAIVPHQSDDLPWVAKAIYIGTGGNLVIRPVESAEDVVLTNVVAGSIIPIRIRAVRTATTASNLVGLG